jgi:hypothetical protein
MPLRRSFEFVSDSENDGFVSHFPSGRRLAIQPEVVLDIEEEVLIDRDSDPLVRIDAECITGSDVIKSFMPVKQLDAIRP